MGNKVSAPEDHNAPIPDANSSLPAGDVNIKFVATCQGKQVGLRVGRQYPRCHDPYRCNGGGVQGEYGVGNAIQVCDPAHAMTLVYCRSAPHASKLLDRANPSRCINIAWWKFKQGTTCVMYDAYPTGPAYGMRFRINQGGTISAEEKPNLVLDLSMFAAPPEHAPVPMGVQTTPVAPPVPVVVQGTPVGGAAASSSAAASMPPLQEACEMFKRELGVSGSSLTEVVDAACEMLGIADTKGANLMQKAEKCWVCIKGPLPR
jgi:hypothetical protein